VPEDSLAEYDGKWPEEPYKGDNSYLPHRRPRAAYAAMVTRLDRDIGDIIKATRELGLYEKTIFIFSSDNGPLYNKLGGTDTDFFESAGAFRGRKGSLYEGGIHVPAIVSWKGRIAAGSMSDRVTGFEDWLPTLLELIGYSALRPPGIDGISFAQTLLRKTQDGRPFLYREFPGYGGWQMVRVGDWKGVRRNLNPAGKAAQKNELQLKTELYHLKADVSEEHDISAAHPDVVRQIEGIMREQHQPSAIFPMAALDTAKN
jgi:arylsulfatase A-like enzyme